MGIATTPSFRPVLFGPGIRRINTSRKTIALTFDDGPNPPHTEGLLEVLARHDVKATFFMVGKQVDRHPDSAAAVVASGHEVGNHSYSHRRLVLRPPGFVRREIERADSALRKVGVRERTCFRSPYGAQLLTVPRLLRETDRPNVLYDVSPRDWSTQDPEVIVRRTLLQARPGSIVLLHDGGGDRRGTVRATDLLIPPLLDRGYRFATVSELLAMARSGR